MKRYIKNLWFAVTGSNPYQQELDEKDSQYNRTVENFTALQQQYFNALEKWEQAEKNACSLQQLVENLRQRIKEKDAEMESAGREFHDRMERMKADYQKRIDEYNLKIEEMQTPLPQ